MVERQTHPNNYNLRSGLTLYPVQQEAIENLLTDLAQQVPAHFILLAGVTGQVVSTRGEQSQIDLVALASLVSGDLAASQEIARLTGQYQDSQMVLREGQSTHTFICEAGHHLAMMIQISTETPLGWARMIIRQAAHQLDNIVANPPLNQKQTDQPPAKLAIASEDNLPDLFDEALDDLWSET